MAIVWAVCLVYSFLCVHSQYIYLKENNRFASNGETMMEIRELLIQQERIQKSVDSLRQMVKSLEEDVTSVHEDVQILKKELSLDVVDCQDLCITGHKQSGEYTIYPFGIKSPVNVYCDMVTERGGWTAIQKRVSGAVSFDRTWVEYKNGFGFPNGSYWIGNDVIHQLTKGTNSSLYVSITLTNGTKLYELYNQFSIADETNKYRLFLGGPATGTLGDSMMDVDSPLYNDLSGMLFTTPDRDHDWTNYNCADWAGGGGWWFKACQNAFLNGPWASASWIKPWWPIVERGSAVRETLMLIRHH